MPSIVYKFKRSKTPGHTHQYEAIHPETNNVVGYVFGTSNKWRAEHLDGKAHAANFGTKQNAAQHVFQGAS